METAFETFAAGLEVTRGTLIDPPTHFFGWTGTMTPDNSYSSPDMLSGDLFYHHEQLTRQSCTWEVSGPARPRYAPFWFNMITGPGVISTPTDGVLTNLHTHSPSGTTDAIKTASLWWGDPNIQLYSAPYAYVNDWEISSDASGTDVATMSLSGRSRYWSKDSATIPAHTTGTYLPPARAQAWLDTGATAIGSTLLSLRVVSASISGSTGVTSKWYYAGSGLNFSNIGRGLMDVSSTITMEVPDTTELDLMDAGTLVKLRVRLNGDLIESVGAGPTLYYSYLQWDIWGRLKFDSFGDLEGSNRTVTFTVRGLKDATAGVPFKLYAQNSSATV